ncbi:MAG: AAA family ATPase [Clostridiales bacterium]|nr:AAA family ATPase [Clostridiales bacterium]
MGRGIIVCGCNGSGKSTLGRELAQRLRYEFIDIEDCYFPNENSDYMYDSPRSRDEAEAILADKVRRCDRFVIAAVKGNFRIPLVYDCAVFISVPKDIRMQRVRDRSYEKFGDRILPGGDIYEREQAFFDMVEARSERDVEEWLDTLDCRVIRVDGTKAIDDNVMYIVEKSQ